MLLLQSTVGVAVEPRFFSPLTTTRFERRTLDDTW